MTFSSQLPTKAPETPFHKIKHIMLGFNDSSTDIPSVLYNNVLTVNKIIHKLRLRHE